MSDEVDLASLKILVVDDQEFVRTIVRKILDQLGVGTVLEAQDGHAGLRATIAERPDLVICDIQMRPMDGFALVATLRGSPAIAATPVVMLTAHSDAVTMDRGKDLNIGAFLAKPVTPQALRDTIAAVLAHRLTRA